MEHSQGQRNSTTVEINGQTFEVIADLGKVVVVKPKTKFYSEDFNNTVDK